MKQQSKDFVATSWDVWKILAVKQGKTAHETSIKFGKSQTPRDGWQILGTLAKFRGLPKIEKENLLEIIGKPIL